MSYSKMEENVQGNLKFKNAAPRKQSDSGRQNIMHSVIQQACPILLQSEVVMKPLIINSVQRRLQQDLH
jgi:hypothetical protein